ncbi:MAG: hypothetical protein L0H38_03395 [bacterium]|nr:hypothetical protein [bacterium]
MDQPLLAQSIVSSCLDKYYPTLREDYIFEYIISPRTRQLSYDEIMLKCVRRIHYFLRENLRDEDDVEQLIGCYLRDDKLNFRERAVAKFSLFLEDIETAIVQHHNQSA